jgi:hypothetical protein
MKEEHPKGTLVLLVIFMVTMIVLWSYVYMTMLERGVTR